MKKLLLASAAAVVLAAGAAGYVLVNKDDQKQQNQTSSQTAQTEKAPQNEVSYEGVEGKTALDLLKQSHKVEVKTYEGLGELVTSIDGVVADSKHFWAFYVNEQQSQVGASSYIAKDGDVIKWKLEKVQ